MLHVATATDDDRAPEPGPPVGRSRRRGRRDAGRRRRRSPRSPRSSGRAGARRRRGPALRRDRARPRRARRDREVPRAPRPDRAGAGDGARRREPGAGLTGRRRRDDDAIPNELLAGPVDGSLSDRRPRRPSTRTCATCARCRPRSSWPPGRAREAPPPPTRPIARGRRDLVDAAATAEIEVAPARRSPRRPPAGTARRAVRRRRRDRARGRRLAPEDRLRSRGRPSGARRERGWRRRSRAATLAAPRARGADDRLRHRRRRRPWPRRGGAGALPRPTSAGAAAPAARAGRHSPRQACDERRPVSRKAFPRLPWHPARGCSRRGSRARPRTWPSSSTARRRGSRADTAHASGSPTTPTCRPLSFTTVRL